MKNVCTDTSTFCEKRTDIITSPAKIAKLIKIRNVLVLKPKVLNKARRVKVPVETLTDNQPT